MRSCFFGALAEIRHLVLRMATEKSELGLRAHSGGMEDIERVAIFGKGFAELLMVGTTRSHAHGKSRPLLVAPR